MTLEEVKKAVEADTEGRWNAMGVLEAVTARIEALEADNASQHREFMEAIDYAADIAGIEADTFIRVWREGGCEEQSDEHNEWEDFRAWRAARRAREGGNADG